ncbi:hypothetical protein [Hyphomonas sp.]|uniref:hypothetical protein n=1 Tax=Hyphomonas sp. TaxID=87 RepID=UPI0025C02D2C|nr:hypothetical protein [Hyphomonas sp.]
MANPLVIFARPNDPLGGAWLNLQISAFDADGRRLENDFERGSLIVMRDTITRELMPTHFDGAHPVLWVEHGSKPPSDEQYTVIRQWPNQRRAKIFSHVPGAEIYEKLKIILHRNSHAHEIASAIESLKSGIFADAEWMIINNVAMLEQTRILNPEAVLGAWEAEIRTTELGDFLLGQGGAAGGIQAAISNEVARLSRSQD